MFFVPSRGIEPRSQVPQTRILSVELWGPNCALVIARASSFAKATKDTSMGKQWFGYKLLVLPKLKC